MTQTLKYTCKAVLSSPSLHTGEDASSCETTLIKFGSEFIARNYVLPRKQKEMKAKRSELDYKIDKLHKKLFQPTRKVFITDMS